MLTKEKLNEDLYNKIPSNSKIIIFGAGEVGQKMLADIKNNTKDVEVVGFIDNFKKGTFCELPIFSFKDFIEQKEIADIVVSSTKTEENSINNILSVYEIPVVSHTEFLNKYYRKDMKLLSEENLKNVLKILSDDEDKKLYETLYKVRKCFLDVQVIKEYYDKNYGFKTCAQLSIVHQYLDKINTSKIECAVDAGMNSGLNVIAFNKLLPNLKKTFGFEACYDEAKVPFIEDFILNDKLEIIDCALGDSVGKTKFLMNTQSSYSSYCGDISTKKLDLTQKKWREVEVGVTTLDECFYKKNIKVDFIKMDIEGAEMLALKAGMKTIQKYRPQLAISIYHSDDDFINIPKYLFENLENYVFKIGHYHHTLCETVLYAIPKELI